MKIIHAVDCDRDEDCSCGTAMSPAQIVDGAHFEIHPDPEDRRFSVMKVRFPNPELVGLERVSCVGRAAVDALEEFIRAFTAGKKAAEQRTARRR